MILAHSLAPGMGDLLNGLLHPLFSPPHWLALAGGSLWAGQCGEKQTRGLLASIPAGVVAAFLMQSGHAVLPDHPARFLLLAVMSAAGGLAAANIKAPAPLAAAAGFLVAGLITAQTFAEDAVQAPALAFATGLLLSLTVTGLLIAALSRHLSAGRPWQRIAVRVAGSWILALGILMLALPAK